MKRSIAAVVCVALAGGPARADEPASPPAPPIDRLRAAYEAGDFVTVRRELLAAYALDPRPELLFALGQVEFNLGHFQAAISYYQRFVATGPSDDQIALAQQAIGAARARLAEPPAPPRSPAVDASLRATVPPRRWTMEDTGLVALGGAAVLVGSGLLVYSQRLGNDRSGTLADYDARVELSRTTRWTGLGVATTGALVAGIAVLRWRLRPDGTALTASIGPGAATFVLGRRW